MRAFGSMGSGIKEPWKQEIWEEITTEVNNVLLVLTSNVAC